MACVCSVIVVGLFSFIPYVDWAAHLGGLVAGMLVGIPIFAFHIENGPCRVVWVLLGTAATVATFAFALIYMYSGAVDPADELGDVCGYYKEFFEDYECVVRVMMARNDTTLRTTRTYYARRNTFYSLVATEPQSQHKDHIQVARTIA